MVARRKLDLFVTQELLEEYQFTARRLWQAHELPKNPEPALNWIENATTLVEPAQLGKQRSRDPDDEKVLAAALAANARAIITLDPDLLELEKPIGISILKPIEFMRWLESEASGKDTERSICWRR